MQSIMNLTGQQQEEGGQKSSPLDLTLRKKASVWYRRSLRGIYGQYTQNSSSLPRGCKPRQSRSNSLVDHNPQRITIVLNKEDHETFGFEIQTRPLRLRSSSSVEMCTFVCRVHEDSVAESAGLTAGDIIATINGVSTEGSSHQRILDLIRESTNILKMETVYGNVMKRLELEKRMNLLKLSLREKLIELQELTIKENRLMRGNLDDTSIHTSESQSSSTRLFSSESSCRSVSTNSDSVFDDVSSPSPCSSASITDDGCFFSRDFSACNCSARFSSSSSSLHQNLSRSSSSSLAGSSSSLSPPWEITRISSLFGTLPRKGRKASVRKHILKLFPGFQRSVEEEEMGTDTQ
ncbi:cytohesin-interacting protein isoform X1 [Gouania willdenowi]|uniref:PDZ domain-containing protein n=1 Tax=Gouania willdenowi TaxID=441366 RepID=A0A8C5HYU3_GOUWI|nr:cytohesin-interacting protein isoform X1 [Gouania willdenowi]